jgi:lipopolysaccharide/colanic/teichoic acid biosynthesis glycosyltransferase
MLKRLFDVGLSSFALVLFAPLLIALGLVVLFRDGRPVFFMQSRVGQYGKPFRIFKFRTMTLSSDGPQVSASNDRRITANGAWLRRTKLDELPQLFNVLLGEMSLVGPRPELEKFVALYPEQARAEILSVRPGITDEASIEFIDEGRLLEVGGNPESTYVNEILPRKIVSYQRYVRHHSLAGDLSILIRTLLKAFR